MRGLIHGTMHLSIGQEASAVGSILPLRRDDYILSTHRGHGHCIAKGADPARMLAEFFGKENGYCRGRGGSMHIADIEGGNLGANGIVGRRAADRRRRRHEHQDAEAGRACAWCSSATARPTKARSTRRSTWRRSGSCRSSSSARTTSTAMSMDIALAMAVPNVADRASAYAMPGVAVDGNDLAGRRRRGARGDRPGAQRRRAVARRVQDVPLARPLARATATSTARRKRSRRGASAIRSAASKRELVAHGRFDAAELAAIERGGAAADRGGARIREVEPGSRSRRN